MNYSSFKSSILSKASGIEVHSSTSCLGETIVESNGVWTILSTKEQFNSLEEVRDTIKNRILLNQLEQEIQKDIYENLSYRTVAELIREHSTDKITDTLIESYISLASSKEFTLNPVVEELRKYNRFGNLVEGKIDYHLRDGSIIAISEQTLTKLKLHGFNQEVIEFMAESKSNFLSVIELLED